MRGRDIDIFLYLWVSKEKANKPACAGLFGVEVESVKFEK
jgi:hypothetical protein